MFEDHGLRRRHIVHFGVEEAMNVPGTLERDTAFAIAKVGIGVLFTLRCDFVLVDQINGKLKGLGSCRRINGYLRVVIADEWGIVLPEPTVPDAERLHIHRGKAYTIH